MIRNTEHVYFEPVFLAIRNLNYLMDKGISFKGKRVLDIGCGTGVYATKIFELGADYVLGIDESETNVGLAQQKAIKGKVEFVQARFEEYKSRDQFDFIFARGVIYYMKDVNQAFLDFFNLLENKGEVFVTFTQKTLKTKAINLVKHILSGLPNSIKPLVRQALSWIFFVSFFWKGGDNSAFETISSKMNTVFFPAKYLLKYADVETLILKTGFNLKSDVMRFNNEIGVWMGKNGKREC